MSPVIGVLALQGDVASTVRALERRAPAPSRCAGRPSWTRSTA